MADQDGTVEVESLELDERTLRLLRDHLLLFYTGETRSGRPASRSWPGYLMS